MNGSKLRELRKKAGYTQTSLAQKAGVDRSYINKIEQGKMQPSIPFLERLANVLNCSLKDFF